MGLAKKVLQGNVRATARLLREVEEELPGAVEELKILYPHTGRSYIIGVTGSPGSGKSTLIDVLIDAYRKQGKTVGVIAVDPSSPFSGGAILGDRIRMQRHSTDEGVFIRSLATRGWHGGLSKAAANILHVMDAMGRDVILMETVGVGQAEVDIMNFAHTCIVVLVPGTGDWVQTLKAGILEIADILVINKGDKEGVNEVEGELQAMLRMSASCPGAWKPKILVTEAINNKGIEELAEGIEEHREFLVASGKYEADLRERGKLELIEVLKASVIDRVFGMAKEDDYLERVIDDLTRRRVDPYTAASEILKKVSQETRCP